MCLKQLDIHLQKIKANFDFMPGLKTFNPNRL